jgi:GT2 family glycosyltransferase
MIGNSSRKCSLIIVNYNGRHYLADCLQSILQLAYPEESLEIIVVDNGSRDNSIEFIREQFPQVEIICNEVNSFARALNLGIAKANGQYIGFLNNDATLDRHWLRVLVDRLENNDRVGAVGGKILLSSGKINSVGHKMLPNYYWEDIGIGKPDKGQYNTEKDVEGLCWAAVLFRRDCLEDVGPIDEDFVMYLEDVDYAKRCQIKGWKSRYIPEAIATHVFWGSSGGQDLPAYFCNRNRLSYLAKHEPRQLVPAIDTSVFTIKKQYNWLYSSLLMAAKKIIQHQSKELKATVLDRLNAKLTEIYGDRIAQQFFARLQVIHGDRPMSLCIYDHALHCMGGGQKYVATIASILQDKFDITYISNKPVQVADLETWYGLNLSRCRLKIIPIPFFEKRHMPNIDGSVVTAEMDNPFEIISEESQHYDIFINVNQLEKVKPRSPISIFFCHFPDSWRTRHFAVDDYTFLIANSQFTTQWLKKRWNLEPTLLLYPPVEMASVSTTSENANIENKTPEKIILSVARFEAGGGKKQVELVQAFQAMQAAYPHLCQGWKLILVGGSTPGNPYLKTVRKAIESQAEAIELQVNLSGEELQKLYAKASLFWHACGIGEVNPQRYEHFGMATVEAMQNGCVPIVFNGGGQSEIVEPWRSGFLCDTLTQFGDYTQQLIANPDLLAQMQQAAKERGSVFNRDQFEEKVRSFFEIIHDEYTTLKLPDPAEVLKGNW